MKWLKKVSVTPLTSVAKVIDSVAAQVNDRFNAPSIHAVREYVNENMLTIYPVGSIYLSVNPDNPGLVFGGTWERIKDKFILAAGDTYSPGATGGAANHSHTVSTTVAGHTLTTSEMPAHSHNIEGVAKAPTGADGIPYNWNDDVFTGSVSGTRASTVQSSTATLELEGTAVSVGGSQAHSHTASSSVNTVSNLPPYLSVYAWKRTA